MTLLQAWILVITAAFSFSAGVMVRAMYDRPTECRPVAMPWQSRPFIVEITGPTVPGGSVRLAGDGPVWRREGDDWVRIDTLPKWRVPKDEK